MNIAIYTPYYFPTPCACSVRVNNFKEALVSARHNTTIITPQELKSNFDLIPKIFNGNYDMVIGTSPPMFPNFLILVGAKLSGKKFIFDSKDHYTYLARKMGIYSNPLKLLFLELLENILYKYSDLVIFVTPRDMKEYAKKYNLKRDRILLIPNGFDPSIGRFSQADRKDLRKRLLKNKDSKLLIYAGSIGDENLIDFIKNAGKEIAELNVELLLIVSLDTVSAGELVDLLAAAREEGIAEYCHYFINIPFTEMHKYYSAADLALIPLPSFWNNCLPVKVFDALYFGLPLAIKAPGGSLKDFVNSFGGGFYASDWQQFIKELQSALVNFKSFKRKGRQGQEAVLKYYSRELFSKQLTEKLEVM